MSNIKLKDHNWAAEGIYDTNQSKSQQTINSDVSTKIGQATLQTSSQNLSGAANELKGRADTLDSKYDNVVTVANTQPSSEYNKVWLPLTVNEGTQVPTWAEHQALESSLNGAISDVETAITKDNISQTIFKGSDGAPANLNNDFFGIKPYNPSSANSPVANTYGAVQSFTANGTYWKFQLAFDTGGGVYVRKNINDGGWTAWEGLNTVETGTITATSNLTGLFDKTVKKQMNLVNLNMTTDNSTSATIGLNYTTILATIPSGFRPPSTLFVPAVYYLNGSTATVTLAQITSGGNISFLTQTANTKIGYIRLNTTYFV